MSGISSVLSIVKGGGRPSPVRAYIIPLDPYNSDNILYSQKAYFQYFPETITSSKQTNWEKKIIPGLSHPLYQWIAGDAHEVSFTAIFTRDRQPTPQQTNLISNPGSTSPMAKSIDPRNVDIPSAVAWLRQFVYPDYSQDGSGKGTIQHPKAPRKLILGIPGLHLAIGNGNADESFMIMTQCEVSYEAFFSNGSPRIARVQLQFAETIQLGGRIYVQDAYAFRTVAAGGYKLTQANQDKKQS